MIDADETRSAGDADVPTDPASAGGAEAPGPNALLTGSLPCVTCDYELKGLSVRDNCPECGTAVRATILSAIDPLADELAPLRAPSLTGVLIIAWAVAGAAGVWLILAMRLVDGLTALGVRTAELWWGWNVAFTLLVICALGTMGFLAPTRRTPSRCVACAAASILAYVPFFYAMLRIRAIDVTQGSAASFYTSDPSVERILWRIVVGGCLLVIFLGIRPNARELVRRSLAMRTGRVDRQTLLAMAMASVVMIIGDLIRLWGAVMGIELLVLVGSLVILIATVFLGVGMTAAMVDGLRIRRSLRLGPRRMRDLVGDAPPDGGDGAPGA